jgi:hypothetical protein
VLPGLLDGFEKPPDEEPELLELELLELELLELALAMVLSPAQASRLVSRSGRAGVFPKRKAPIKQTVNPIFLEFLIRSPLQMGSVSQQWRFNTMHKTSCKCYGKFSRQRGPAKMSLHWGEPTDPGDERKGR